MNKQADKGIRIGVIGCGAIAELYHLPALKACRTTADGIVLVEPNTARLAKLQQQFEVPESVNDYHDLVGRVDGVIVATPPTTHFEISHWCLDQGLHVLCEKPLTESISEARELVDLAEQRQVKLAVNQTRRLFPTYVKIRQLIEQGVLGEIRSIVYHDGAEFSWPAASPHHFQPGARGAWSDVGVHLLDAICYWLNGRPQITASLNDSACGPEAMATVRGTLDAAVFEIKVSRLGRLSNSFKIVGTLGSIEAEAEDWDEFEVRFTNGTKKRYRCGSNRLQYNDFAKPLIENFAQVVAANAEPLVSGESTLATIELLEEAYSMATLYQMPWNDRLPELALTAGGSSVKVLDSKRRILVTGASGFLGGRVVETLQRSETCTPIAMLRQWSRAARIACSPIEVTLGDILNRNEVLQAVSQADAVVHCAYGDDRNSIVEGTRNLLDAALEQGVNDFVYLSSAEAYGSELSGVVVESADVKPTGNDYGDAKLEAENVCRSYHARGLKPSILRPSLIYGPFGMSWSVDVATRLASGNWGIFDGFGEGTANLVYVDDLVQAILLAMSKPEAKGETFNVNGPDRISWNEYFVMYNEALGLPPLKPISSTKSRAKTFVMDQVSKCTAFAKSRWEDKLMEIYLRGGWASQWMKKLRGALKSTPSAGELTNLYSRNANYDDAKIKSQLGYLPQYDLKAGIAATLPWLKLHEILPPHADAAGHNASPQVTEEQYCSAST